MVTKETTIIKKIMIAENTLSVYFKKPDGFEYKAGQSIDMTLIDPPKTDTEGNTRAYSLASAPHEEDLMITTRLRESAFKQVLKDLPEESKINIDGPFGSFILHNDVLRPAVFLMGGIGITPARSIIIEASEKMLPHKIYLFYSNRRPEDAAFMDDLIGAAKKNPNFTFVPTMTEMDKSKESWAGETGYITKEMVLKYITDLSKPIYYLAGPPAMVAAMHKLLNEAGINDDNIKMEEFSGY